MNVEEHAKAFREIIEKHKLEDKAEEIAKFLISTQGIKVGEFAKKYGLNDEEAFIILTFVEKGIKWRESNSTC